MKKKIGHHRDINRKRTSSDVRGDFVPGRRAGKGAAKPVDKFSDEQLKAMVDGARFAYAHPSPKTKFQQDFEAAIDAYLRRLDKEEAEAGSGCAEKSPPKGRSKSAEFPGKSTN